MKIIDMRKIITLAVVAATLLSSAIGAQAQQRRQVMLDKVVAVVGGSSILHSEVQEYEDGHQGYRRNRVSGKRPIE